MVRAEMEEDQIWRFSKFFVAKMLEGRRGIVRGVSRAGRHGCQQRTATGMKASPGRMNRQEEVDKICSDVI